MLHTIYPLSRDPSIRPPGHSSYPTPLFLSTLLLNDPLCSMKKAERIWSGHKKPAYPVAHVLYTCLSLHAPYIYAAAWMTQVLKASCFILQSDVFCHFWSDLRLMQCNFLTASAPLTVIYLTSLLHSTFHEICTIDGTEFGTEVPPGGIVWHYRAIWTHNLVLKCHLAAILGTEFYKSQYW